MTRYNKFLGLEEKSVNIQDDLIEFGSVELRNLTGSWVNQPTAKAYNYKGDTNSIAIKNIEFVFQPGKLYAVVGKVGSGKSSLLYSALGELDVKSGTVKKNGSLAFIP